MVFPVFGTKESTVRNFTVAVCHLFLAPSILTAPVHLALASNCHACPSGWSKLASADIGCLFCFKVRREGVVFKNRWHWYDCERWELCCFCHGTIGRNINFIWSIAVRVTLHDALRGCSNVLAVLFWVLIIRTKLQQLLGFHIFFGRAIIGKFDHPNILSGCIWVHRNYLTKPSRFTLRFALGTNGKGSVRHGLVTTPPRDRMLVLLEREEWTLLMPVLLLFLYSKKLQSTRITGGLFAGKGRRHFSLSHWPMLSLGFCANVGPCSIVVSIIDCQECGVSVFLLSLDVVGRSPGCFS